MMHIAQAAADVAKSSSYVTGQFVVDGVLLIAGLKAVELVISKVRGPKGNGKGPKLGEGTKCQAHGEAISKLEEFRGNTKDALERIEGKVDRLLERK